LKYLTQALFCNVQNDGEVFPGSFKMKTGETNRAKHD